MAKFTEASNPYQLSEQNLQVIGTKSGVSKSEMSMYHGSTGFNTENNYQADGDATTINRHQSTGNLFSIGDQLSEDENLDRVFEVKIPQPTIITKKPFDSKVTLTNATTLRPYMRLRNKFVELVPIFYKRDPKKTRNSLAQSIHSIHFLNEVASKSNVQEDDQITIKSKAFPRSQLSHYNDNSTTFTN